MRPYFAETIERGAWAMNRLLYNELKTLVRQRNIQETFKVAISFQIN